MRDNYRGWNFSTTRGYGNSQNDLEVTIMPAVQLDPLQTDHLTVAERGKLQRDLLRKKEKYTHRIRIVAKETVLFFFKAVPWDDAKPETIKYIDKTLGTFDLQKFIDSE